MPIDLATAVPAPPHTEEKRRAAAAVEAARDEILELSHAIHADPEPAFEERRAAARVAEGVARHGYVGQQPAGRRETAVRGVLRGRGQGTGPRIAVLAEYDALPGLGHGCGHNTMAASGVGAAIALAAVADAFAGEVVFLGTPAEERGSGKQWMLDDGLFDGCDAALLFHPSDLTHVEIRLLASVDVEVTFTGLQAHAASDPWQGRNALDALILLFQAVGLWRQQLKPDARVHGIVLEGGTAANIIPDRAVARFMLRSTDERDFEAMQGRFREMVEGAALSTGTTGEARSSGGSSTMRHNRVLGRLFAANMAAYGVADGPPPMNMGSSDMGNVSQRMPTIHPELAICDAGVAGHSIAFREAAATERADEVTLLVSTLVAQTALDLLLDPSLVEAAWREFRAAD
ncbi:MAG TPA: M20 family metallopeptidase [Candidatus Dormibacteraeota bacterium]|nr:M20 family metallopeptidase [Candidatus Dormibacteraeota bacterium]